MAFYRHYKTKETMKNILLIFALFSCVISTNAQVRPDQAIEKTTAEDTDEIYSQYNGLLRRIKFSTAKTYFQTGLTLLDLGISDGTSGQVLTTDGSGNFSFTTVSSGTDDQTLSFAGTTLSIESGNSVDLSSLQDGTGTDDQTAAEVSFSPTGNILSSNVQSMGEELQAQIDAIQTTSGVVNGVTNLGTFSGSTISDNTDTKTALQELEVAVEGGSSVWTESSGDIYYNSGDVGIGTTTPTALLHTVGGDVIFDSGASGFKSFKFLFNGVEIGGATTKSARFSFYGGSVPSEHLHLSTVGDVGINTVSPITKLHVFDGGDYQLTLARSASVISQFRSTPDETLDIVNSTDGGTTTTQGLYIGGSDIVVANNTDVTLTKSAANCIVRLEDSTNDSDKSTATVPSSMNLNGMVIIVGCKTGSLGGDADDGCEVQVTSTTIEGGSSYTFSSDEVGKYIRFRFSDHTDINGFVKIQ